MKTVARRAAAAALLMGFACVAWADPLVFCTQDGPRGFDPARHADPFTFDASSRQIYDRLVEFAPGSTALRPGLAERWEVSDDGLVHTFELREGVAFQSGEAFVPSRTLTADDVVFSFERQRLAEHPYHGVGGGWAYFAAMDLGALIASVEPLGERRVAFVLTRPDAGFPAKLAMDFASILSAEYADAMLAAGTPERLDEAPIGTGPFALASATGGDVTYRPFADHWAGAPELEGLVIRAIPDARARSEAVAEGACHVAARPVRAGLAALEAAGDIAVERTVGLDVGYLAFNTSQPPFDDARVRRALAMAIDRAEIVRTLFDGEAAAARSPLPPALRPTEPEEAAAAGHDPAAARAMLAEAGIEGLTMTIWALPVRRSYNPDGFRMAELIRADFAEIGVEAEIVSYDWPDYLRRSRAPDREGAVLFGWQGMSGDPDAYLSDPLSCSARTGGNRAQWCNPRFDALVERARAEGDPEARQALYAEAETIFLEEAPWASIAHPMVLTAVRREVEGFVADPFGRHIFRGVTLDTD